jgi:hypothetical protein
MTAIADNVTHRRIDIPPSTQAGYSRDRNPLGTTAGDFAARVARGVARDFAASGD